MVGYERRGKWGKRKSGASIHPSSVAGVSDCEQKTKKSKAAMTILSSAFYFRCSIGNRSHPSLGQLVKESPSYLRNLPKRSALKRNFGAQISILDGDTRGHDCRHVKMQCNRRTAQSARGKGSL